MSPTKPHAQEIHLSTIGFEDNEFHRLLKLAEENELLKDTPDYDKSLGLFFRSGEEVLVPWLTAKFLEKQRKHSKSQIYKRLWQNTYTPNEEKSFITQSQLNGIINNNQAVRRVNRQVRGYVGIDASVSGDTTAVCFIERREDDGIYRLIDHSITVPTAEKRINYEEAIIKVVNEWNEDKGYDILSIIADPYQTLRLLEEFEQAGFETYSFTQSTGNLSAMANYLYTLIDSQKIEIYDDPELRKGFNNCATKLVSGSEEKYRIVKQNTKAKIDIIIAIAMTCYSIAQGIDVSEQGEIEVMVGSWGAYPNNSKARVKCPVFMSDPLGVYNR